MSFVKNIEKISFIALLTLPALAAAYCDPPTYGNNAQMNQIAVNMYRQCLASEQQAKQMQQQQQQMRQQQFQMQQEQQRQELNNFMQQQEMRQQQEQLQRQQRQ